MKLVTFSRKVGVRVGALSADKIIDLPEAFQALQVEKNRSEIGGIAQFPTSMIGLLAAGDQALEVAKEVVHFAMENRSESYVIPMSEAKLLAPIPRPPAIICIAVNYPLLAKTVALTRGNQPNVFLKAPTSVIGPGDAVVLPSLDIGPVITELELGVIIGRGGRYIPREKAYEVVAGYTIFLDITAGEMLERDAFIIERTTSDIISGRAGVKKTAHTLFFRCKSWDTFGPMGPALVTKDEVKDPHALEIDGYVGEDCFVKGKTSDMIFKIPQLIEFISSVMTLEPGTVITTGHPGHIHRRPLRPAEIVESHISSIGSMATPVLQEDKKRG